jgi:hypothetical protein
VTECYVATYKYGPESHVPIGWKDSKGLHIGSVELIESRTFNRAVAEHGTVPDPKQTLHDWLAHVDCCTITFPVPLHAVWSGSRGAYTRAAGHPDVNSKENSGRLADKLWGKA